MREVDAQVKMLFRLTGEAPTKIGKAATERAGRSGNRGRGVLRGNARMPLVGLLSMINTNVEMGKNKIWANYPRG